MTDHFIPGNTVLCNFPDKSTPDKPGIYTVPCFVLGVESATDTSPAHLIVCSSSKYNLDKIYPSEVKVEYLRDIADSGFLQPRKINTRDVRRIPITENFLVPKNDSYILGNIKGYCLQKLKTTYERSRKYTNDLPEIEDFKPYSPKIGDIILAKPPYEDSPVPREKPTPCLVVNIENGEAGTPNILHVIPSSYIHEDRIPHPNDLFLTQPEDIESAGTTFPRKFSFHHLQKIPMNRDYLFSTRERGDCYLGKLSDRAWETAIECYAKSIHSHPNLENNNHWMPEKPKKGDIVYAFVPYEENPDMPGPKPRPAIVTHIEEKIENGKPVILLTLCPGTSQKTDQIKDSQFIIEDEDQKNKSGLQSTTKFLTEREITIPWNQHYICFHDKGPILGHIDQKIELEFAYAKHRNMQKQIPEKHKGLHDAIRY